MPWNSKCRVRTQSPSELPQSRNSSLLGPLIHFGVRFLFLHKEPSLCLFLDTGLLEKCSLIKVIVTSGIGMNEKKIISCLRKIYSSLDMRASPGHARLLVPTGQLLKGVWRRTQTSRYIGFIASLIICQRAVEIFLTSCNYRHLNQLKS